MVMCSSTNACVSLEGSIHTEMRHRPSLSLQAQSVEHRHSRRGRVSRNRRSEIEIEIDSLRGIHRICYSDDLHSILLLAGSMLHQVSSPCQKTGLTDRWPNSRTRIREVCESSSEPNQIGLIRS